jgi:hypothetical protein
MLYIVSPQFNLLMKSRAILFLITVCLIIVCSGCQSGKIPCPEIKFAKLKQSKIQKGNQYVASPARMMASNKSIQNREEAKRAVELERMKSSRVTGKQMLEQYGTVEEWDCPSPLGKKKYSKVTKDNIRKNERKMREHIKQRDASDSIAVAPPRDLH